jgi:outer membrane protein assembly factor BamB
MYFEPNEQSPSGSGHDYTNSQIIAYDANSGQMLWWTVIERAVYGSWSTPCIDTKHNTVLIGSGSIDGEGEIAPGKVYAIDAVTGAIVWTTQLYGPVVNASICVAVDIPNARAFITDFNFDSSGRLYCINLDTGGQIVWSQAIGNTCGNTPAYRSGVVYTATADGAIYAYNATANSAVELWKFTNPDYDGFYGGVVVTKEGYLYAATCSFYTEEEDNSTLFKINSSNGSVVWTTPVQDTDCVPVVVGDKIYVSGGAWTCRVKAYQDLGTSVVKLWGTDANLSVGGWDDQPVYANGKLYIGAIFPGEIFGELCVLDVTVTPNDPDFITRYTDWWCGVSRAVTYDSLYAIGADGLFKFHQPVLLADIDKNGTVDFCDLAELAAVWLYDGAIGVNRADLNLDGKINFTDFSLLAGSWHGELD